MCEFCYSSKKLLLVCARVTTVIGKTKKFYLSDNFYEFETKNIFCSILFNIFESNQNHLLVKSKYPIKNEQV